MILIWRTGATTHVSNDSIQRRSTFTHLKRNGICSWQTNKKHSEFTIKSMPTQTAGRVADMPSSIMKHSLLYHPYDCKKNSTWMALCLFASFLSKTWDSLHFKLWWTKLWRDECMYNSKFYKVNLFNSQYGICFYIVIGREWNMIMSITRIINLNNTKLCFLQLIVACVVNDIVLCRTPLNNICISCRYFTDRLLTAICTQVM